MSILRRWTQAERTARAHAERAAARTAASEHDRPMQPPGWRIIPQTQRTAEAHRLRADAEARAEAETRAEAAASAEAARVARERTAKLQAAANADDERT